VLEMTAPPATPATHDLLDAIVEAYAAGDAPLAERYFQQALDNDLPWTDACAAAARGIARCYGEPSRD
jgi:hypothetical protein